MKTKTLITSLAVASLAVAQPAAAATRSYESIPATGVQTAEPADRAGSIIGEAEDGRGKPIFVIGGVFLLLALLLILSAGGGGKSPG
jgi:hypothetical protein